MTREELKEEIAAAFGVIAFPSHQGLRGSMAMDRYASDEEVRAITANQDVHGEWWEIPREELRSAALALSYLDAAGVLFYLPAYLQMALDDVGRKSLLVLYVIDVTGDDNDPGLRGYLEGRLNLLNDAQRNVCMRALHFLRSQLRDDASTEFERGLIDRTLGDPYWRVA
jgi:hypothetical protein